MLEGPGKNAYTKDGVRYYKNALAESDAVRPLTDRQIVRLEQQGDRWVEVNLATGETRTAKGSYIFVTKDKGIFAARRTIGDRTVSHADLAQGFDVKYSGEVTFASGKTTKGTLNQWNNQSGHYLPEAEQAGQAGFAVDKFTPFKEGN